MRTVLSAAGTMCSDPACFIFTAEAGRVWTGPKLQVQEEAQCKEADDSESKVPSWAPSQKCVTVSPGQRAGLGLLLYPLV